MVPSGKWWVESHRFGVLISVCGLKINCLLHMKDRMAGAGADSGSLAEFTERPLESSGGCLSGRCVLTERSRSCPKRPGITHVLPLPS